MLGLARALTALLSFTFFHREVVVAVLCLDTAGCALAATTRDHRGRLIERSGCASVPDCNGFRIS